MNSFLLLLVSAFLFSAALFLQSSAKRRPLAIELPEGDEDIKIASGSFSERPAEDGADLAARDFLRQKDCGNIDRARDLGERFAQALLKAESGPLAGETTGRTPPVLHQIYLLYSYVVNHAIEDHSPNSILAQTSQNVFQSEIEEQSEEIAAHIADAASYSFYILFERSGSRTDEIGRVFAEQAGEESDEALCALGNRLYDKFYHFCVDEVRKTAYIDA